MHKASFGNDTELPYCQCPDWDTHHLPCKHFMAIIKSVHADWEDFPERYRNSSYLTLDQEILFGGTEDQPVIAQDNQPLPQEIESNTIPCSYTEIPVKKYSPRSKAAACRDILKQLTSLTYSVYDEEGLDNLQEQLSKCLDRFEQYVPHEDGLIQETDSKVHRKLAKEEEMSQKFRKMPLRQSKVSKFTGRVGIGAESYYIS